MKGDLPFLRHMLDAVQRVASYLKDVRRDEFLDDPEKQDAVIRQLELIGEAAGRVSASTRGANVEIPWRQITGMRHKLIHDYFVVDLDVVWKTATEDVPGLGPLLEKAIESRAS
jgi:uncharacterized protein with HEPN domain